MKKLFILLLSFIMLLLAGCSNSNNTIQKCVISESKCESRKAMKDMSQPDSLTAGNVVYASVHVVESKKGSEYEVIWYLNDIEIKRETKETMEDMRDLLVYELEADKVINGTLKVEIIYNDTVLFTKELNIQ